MKVEKLLVWPTKMPNLQGISHVIFKGDIVELKLSRLLNFGYHFLIVGIWN
jgi:hypothetical protein